LVSSNSASYIGLHLKIDSECRISTKETISIFLLLTFQEGKNYKYDKQILSLDICDTDIP
jgi:hypothetical protein